MAWLPAPLQAWEEAVVGRPDGGPHPGTAGHAGRGFPHLLPVAAGEHPHGQALAALAPAPPLPSSNDPRCTSNDLRMSWILRFAANKFLSRVCIIFYIFWVNFAIGFHSKTLQVFPRRVDSMVAWSFSLAL